MCFDKAQFHLHCLHDNRSYSFTVNNYQFKCNSLSILVESAGISVNYLTYQIAQYLNKQFLLDLLIWVP